MYSKGGEFHLGSGGFRRESGFDEGEKEGDIGAELVEWYLVREREEIKGRSCL